MEWTQPIRGGLGQVCFRPTVIFSSMTAVQTEQYKDMEWRYSAHILILLVRSMNFRSKITTWFVGWCQHSPMTVAAFFFFFLSRYCKEYMISSYTSNDQKQTRVFWSWHIWMWNFINEKDTGITFPIIHSHIHHHFIIYAFSFPVSRLCNPCSTI